MIYCAMSKRKIFHHIFLVSLVIIVVSAAAVEWFALSSLTRFQFATVSDELETRARIIRKHIEGLLGEKDLAGLRLFCSTVSKDVGARVTIVAPSGIVLADSEEDAERMSNHNDRPEVKAALSGRTGRDMRQSPTLRQTMMYVALPLASGAEVLGVLRLSVSLGSVENALALTRMRMLCAGAVIVLISALASLYVSKRLVRPLENLTTGAALYAAGDFARRIPAYDIMEMNALSEAMNDMASQLELRFAELARQKNQLDSILSSMSEGVVAIDTDGKIILMNSMAKRFFNTPEDVEGRLLHEIVRNPSMQVFTDKIIEGSGAVEADVPLYELDKAHLQAHGAALKDASGKTLGAVAVLTDVTRLKKLENLRGEFVANVSHEFKTPLSAIKGAVEALLADRSMPEPDKRRFLDIINRQSDRLNEMVQDILSLSALEQHREGLALSLREARPSKIIDAAAEACRAKAEAKGVVVDLRIDVDPTLCVDAPLLEQAVANLLDNAIKYSEDGGRVEIATKADAEFLSVVVADNGCGIPEEHLARIFERFHRVDKARSRKLGGTGLGLAIVKHIAIAHRGTVSVESSLGKGSRFTLTLPLGARKA